MDTPPEQVRALFEAAHEIANETLAAAQRVAQERDLDPALLLQMAHSQLMGVAHVLLQDRARKMQ
jgi:hypothetical protein